MRLGGCWRVTIGRPPPFKFKILLFPCPLPLTSVFKAQSTEGAASFRILATRTREVRNTGPLEEGTARCPLELPPPSFCDILRSKWQPCLLHRLLHRASLFGGETNALSKVEFETRIACPIQGPSRLESNSVQLLLAGLARWRLS